MTARSINNLLILFILVIFTILVVTIARGTDLASTIPTITPDQRAQFWRLNAEFIQAQSALNLQVESMRTTCARGNLDLTIDKKSGEPVCIKLAEPAPPQPMPPSTPAATPVKP